MSIDSVMSIRKLCVVGHSLVHLRQQLFFKEVARQGHEVLMISPGEWGNLRTSPSAEAYAAIKGLQQFGRWELVTCRHMGESLYNYRLLGADDLVAAFDPDWLYVQAEPGSRIACDALGWKARKKAIFTWENIGFRGLLENPFSPASVLSKYDLVVCGNPEAEALVKPHNANTLLLLQVGVDMDHFCARPSVQRNIKVAYVGRKVREKGIDYLIFAYPQTHVLEWMDFLQLPWFYSQVQVIGTYSLDTLEWKEQAPPYVALEALACGCKAVISETAAGKYWLEGCPGVFVAKGHMQYDLVVHREMVAAVNMAIVQALDAAIGDKGRSWVAERFSNPVVAKRLLEVLGA